MLITLIPILKLLANYAEEAQELVKHSLQFYVSTVISQESVLYGTSTLHYRCYHLSLSPAVTIKYYSVSRGLSEESF